MNEFGKLHAYQAFVTRRERDAVCTLYLTHVRKFDWTAPSRGARVDETKAPPLSDGEPWIDHADMVLEDLQYVETHQADPCGFTYYRPADRTLIYVEHVVTD